MQNNHPKQCRNNLCECHDIGHTADYAYRVCSLVHPDRMVRKLEPVPASRVDVRGEDDVKPDRSKVNRMGSRRLFNRRRRLATKHCRAFEAETTEQCFEQVQDEMDTSERLAHRRAA
jgi:hypothetical protein